jgi:hypothetical protein
MNTQRSSEHPHDLAAEVGSNSKKSRVSCRATGSQNLDEQRQIAARETSPRSSAGSLLAFASRCMIFNKFRERHRPGVVTGLSADAILILISSPYDE